MTNHRFRVSPLPPDIVRQARRSRTDAFGNDLVERRDDDRHQCRSCLRLTEPGEPYLALAHRPFPTAHPFAETGPIYVHARACAPYSDSHEYPAKFPRQEVVLRAYGSNDEITDARFVGERRVEEVIGELLDDGRNAYLHARNSTYGCFMFRIDRAADGAEPAR